MTTPAAAAPPPSGESWLRRGTRLALAVLFAAAGTAHFLPATRPAFEAIVPPALPAPGTIVAITGVLEILAAVGLLVPRTRRITGWLLALFLVAVFPANVYGAVSGQEVAPGVPHPPVLVRGLLQVVLIGLVLWASGAVRRR